MKRKATGDNLKVNGYYISDLVRGFYGEQDEGRQMLRLMGLPNNHLPFSVAAFLLNKKIFWKDSQGNKATISFRFKPNQMECFGTYKKKRKSIRMFLEWDSQEDPEKIARLESEAIGDLCMRCIFENLIT